MFKLSVIAPALLALSLATSAPVFAEGADATIHQVYLAAEAGRFDDAQAMMDKVLQDHPNSAKAHYVEARLLEKQGRLTQAQTELNTAERLDPSLAFAKSGEVQDLQNRLTGTHPAMQRVLPVQPIVHQQAVQSAPSSTGGLVWIVIIGAVIALILMVRAMMRRTAVIGGGYPGGYAGGGPGYGPGGVVMGPGGGMGGGMGSGILGGLATGAAVGAGIVAGEELMHHFTDHNRDQVVYDNPPQQDDNWSRQDNMGGNDFGVSDSSSWDSGGGGGGGGDDW